MRGSEKCNLITWKSKLADGGIEIVVEFTYPTFRGNGIRHASKCKGYPLRAARKSVSFVGSWVSIRAGVDRLYSPKAKSGPPPVFVCLMNKERFLYFLNDWWRVKRRNICHDMWKLYKIQISLSRNKVLLGHCHIHS